MFFVMMQVFFDCRIDRLMIMILPDLRTDPPNPPYIVLVHILGDLRGHAGFIGAGLSVSILQGSQYALYLYR
jgi:hypothetical protein